MRIIAISNLLSTFLMPKRIVLHSLYPESSKHEVWKNGHLPRNKVNTAITSRDKKFD